MNLTPARDIADLVITALRHKCPLSVIRLGDGEGRLLEWPDRISKEAMDAHLRFWFGRHDFGYEEMLEMRADMTHAIKCSDVVGLPNERNKDSNEHWQEPERWMADHGLLDDRIICDHELHLQLWREDLMGPILREASRIIMFTCRDGIDIANKLRKAYGLTVGFETATLPEEGHTGGRPTRHYQETYPEVMTWLAQPWQKKRMPGTLALVGAGVLGKSYCAGVKRAGGVALDIGSLFDGWAGVGSRSYMRGKMQEFALAE